MSKRIYEREKKIRILQNLKGVLLSLFCLRFANLLLIFLVLSISFNNRLALFVVVVALFTKKYSLFLSSYLR